MENSSSFIHQRPTESHALGFDELNRSLDWNLSLECGVELSEEDWVSIDQYRWIICGILSSILSILGLVGNSISLTILSLRSMKNLFNHLLSCLCIADIVFLTSNILVLPFHFGLKVESLSFLFPILESTCHFALSASIFLIITITIERWQAVCFPFTYQQRNNKTKTVTRHVLPVIIISILFNITKFISISPLGPELQKIPIYLKFILFFQAFHPLTTTGLAPLCILVFLNYKIYAQMSEAKRFYRPGSTSRRTREFILAKTMMVLVLVFLILNTPRLILGLIEVTRLNTVERCYERGLDYNITKITYILDFIARFLVILNSSINFVIYCVFGSQFRQELSTLVKNKLRRISLQKAQTDGNPGREGGEGDELWSAECEGTESTRVTQGSRQQTPLAAIIGQSLSPRSANGVSGSSTMTLNTIKSEKIIEENKTEA